MFGQLLNTLATDLKWHDQLWVVMQELITIVIGYHRNTTSLVLRVWQILFESMTVVSPFVEYHQMHSQMSETPAAAAMEVSYTEQRKICINQTQTTHFCDNSIRWVLCQCGASGASVWCISVV